MKKLERFVICGDKYTDDHYRKQIDATFSQYGIDPSTMPTTFEGLTEFLFSDYRQRHSTNPVAYDEVLTAAHRWAAEHRERPPGDDELYLAPQEGIALLRLGKQTDPQKRKFYSKVLGIIPSDMKRPDPKNSKVTQVRIIALRQVRDMLQTLSHSVDDWSDVDFEAAQQRYQLEFESKRKRG